MDAGGVRAARMGNVLLHSSAFRCRVPAPRSMISGVAVELRLVNRASAVRDWVVVVDGEVTEMKMELGDKRQNAPSTPRFVIEVGMAMLANRERVLVVVLTLNCAMTLEPFKYRA